jgi:hypothetical protein
MDEGTRKQAIDRLRIGSAAPEVDAPNGLPAFTGLMTSLSDPVHGAKICPQILWISLWILVTERLSHFGKMQRIRRRSLIGHFNKTAPTFSLATNAVFSVWLLQGQYQNLRPLELHR